MTDSNIKRFELDFEQGKCLKCPKCNEVISISNSRWAERVLTILRTIRDINKDLSKKLIDVRMSKNGVIQKLHKQVGQLLELMNENQLEKAKEINQVMRDEIKMWEKKTK